MTEALAGAPLVLCGPILRRVELDAVTVWVALRAPATVELAVLDDSGRGPVRSGRAPTVALGERLHVAAVTARGPRLEPGSLYRYDLAFTTAEGRAGLLDAGVLHADGAAAREILGYGGPAGPLPGFAPPPARLDRVRILHGSCRRPHGEGADLLADVDGIIGGAADDPEARPHQLFLTGDQIYADSVADWLLAALTPLGDALLGWEERLPGVDSAPGRLTPGSRAPVVAEHAGFEGEAKNTRSHLLSFGEFCAMYVLAWSDVLWPELPAGPAEAGAEADALAAYRAGIPAVRRALANVPVLTMWDDHEVSDGWFISLGWARRALGMPLGRRVLGNALTAFAVFQAWGNTPERFDAGPGRDLLDALAGWQGEDGPARERIERRVGIPRVDDRSRRLVLPDGALEWSYAVRAPGHDALVLDTRTRRAYPDDDWDEAPGLVADEALDRCFAQLGAGRDPERLLVLVSPPPLVHVPFARLERSALGLFEADRELWENRPEALHALLDRLARASRRIVVLCGDVHLGFTSRFSTRPVGAASEAATIVQASASPLKNQTASKLRFHAEGYELLRGDVLAGPLRFEGPRLEHHVDFLLAEDDEPRTAGAAPQRRPYPPPGRGRDAALGAYLAEAADAAAYAGAWGAGKEIVAVNNLGEVTFLGEGPAAVVHELWWHLEGPGHPFPLTRWEVPFGPDV